MKKAMRITSTKIISLQNVCYADLSIFGTGAKSNPYTYTIKVTYNCGETAFIHFDEDKVNAEKMFDQLLTELNAE